jgi:uncharacterized cupredoxin-like copper-binding protein
MLLQTKTPRAAVALGAVLALAVAASGCGSSDNSGGSSEKAKTKPAPAPAKGNLSMQMGEFYFKPKQVAVSAGKVRITESNVGKAPHEFVLGRSNANPGSLPIGPEGGPDEANINPVGEIADVAAGQTKSKTFDLKPGKYVFICNLPGHYKGGMYGGLTVK